MGFRLSGTVWLVSKLTFRCLAQQIEIGDYTQIEEATLKHIARPSSRVMP